MACIALNQEWCAHVENTILLHALMINTKGETYGGCVAPFVLYLIDHWSVMVTLVGIVRKSV